MIPEKETNMLPDFIQQMIENEINAAIDEEMKKVQERIVGRKAEIVAGVLMMWKERVDMRVLGNVVTFEVKIT